MITRLQISIILGISAIYWAGALCVLGLPVSKELYTPFGLVLTALTITASLFNTYIWKWPLINGWVIKQPKLSGTWKIVLHSDWVDPATNKTIDPIAGYLIIRQTFTHLSVKMVTTESGSESMSSKFKSEDDGTFKLISVYRNIPKAKVRGRSEIHHGTLILSIATADNKIEGEYWTDRKSKGSIELTAKNDNICNSFDEAEKMFSKTTKKD